MLTSRSCGQTHRSARLASLVDVEGKLSESVRGEARRRRGRKRSGMAYEHIVDTRIDPDPDADPDTDFDLFAPSSPDSSSVLRAHRDADRLLALSRLPRPDSRSPKDCRSAYVLSGQPLLPTRFDAVLSDQECDSVLRSVEGYVVEKGRLETQRHQKFPTTDVPVSALTLRDEQDGNGTVAAWLEQTMRDRVLSKMSDLTGIPTDFLGFQDLFIVCYSAPRPKPPSQVLSPPSHPKVLIPSDQTSLPLHRDACLLSFSLLLVPSCSFLGGGTFFPSCSSQTFLLDRGGLLVHDARLEHAGAEVTQGTRVLVVGFVETLDVLKEKQRWATGDGPSRRRRV